MPSERNKYSISENFNAFAMEDSPDTTDLPYNRGSDALANKGQLISFYHVPSQTEIYFKAFLTNFQETYNSDWSSETVYGRVDPIYLFKNTQRKIALGFKVPAASKSEAYENLGRVQKLIQFLYPNYTTLIDPVSKEPDVFAQTISQSPMVRLKVMNLLSDQSKHYSATAGESTGTDVNTYAEYGSSGDVLASAGLLGVIENVTVDHHLQDNEAGAIGMGKGVMLPKLIDINLSFSPIHEHPIGWREDATSESVNPFFNSLFPYGINIEGSVDNPNEASISTALENSAPTESLDSAGDADEAQPIDDPDDQSAAGAENQEAATVQETAGMLSNGN